MKQIDYFHDSQPDESGAYQTAYVDIKLTPDQRWPVFLTRVRWKRGRHKGYKKLVFYDDLHDLYTSISMNSDIRKAQEFLFQHGIPISAPDYGSGLYGEWQQFAVPVYGVLRLQVRDGEVSLNLRRRWAFTEVELVGLQEDYYECRESLR